MPEGWVREAEEEGEGRVPVADVQKNFRPSTVVSSSRLSGLTWSSLPAAERGLWCYLCFLPSPSAVQTDQQPRIRLQKQEGGEQRKGWQVSREVPVFTKQHFVPKKWVPVPR